MTQTALDVLSQNPDSFFLMVESALIDKSSHPLDWERALMSTIMFDKSIEIAKKICRKTSGYIDYCHRRSYARFIVNRNSRRQQTGDDMREKSAFTQPPVIRIMKIKTKTAILID